jgi:hypothetical protein
MVERVSGLRGWDEARSVPLGLPGPVVGKTEDRKVLPVGQACTRSGRFVKRHARAEPSAPAVPTTTPTTKERRGASLSAPVASTDGHPGHAMGGRRLHRPRAAMLEVLLHVLSGCRQAEHLIHVRDGTRIAEVFEKGMYHP